MSFHVGQLVVCISDKWLPNAFWHQAVRTYPKLNSIYTIREIHKGSSLIGFCFYELMNPRAHFTCGYVEPAFNSRNFRPVRRTSIELLEGLLVPADPAAAPRHEHRREKVPA